MTDQGNSRITSLDTLRGAAVVGVVCVHTSRVLPTSIGALDAGLSYGRFGVQLFFLVSAFTMCYMWQQRAGEPFKARNFYIRRFLRIAPLFWLCIPLYLGINGLGESYWSPEGISATDIAMTATFLHGFWPSSVTSVVPGGWSIAVEMMFYALFPLLASSVKMQKHFLWLAVGSYFVNKLAIEPALQSFLVANYATCSKTIIPDFLYLNFFNQLPVLLLGCHLFHSLRQPVGTVLRESVPVFVGWGFLLAALLIAGQKHFGLSTLVTTWALYAGAMITMRKNLALACVSVLGRYCYGIYLSHFMVLHVIGATALSILGAGPLPFVLLLGATILLSLGISMALHNAIERPAAGLAKRLTTFPAATGLAPGTLP
jgi:exopolysaccharide production protein ExoZ